MHVRGLGSSPFARRYSGNRGFFLFLGVLRCFSSPGSLRDTYEFSVRSCGFFRTGFPHSDIHGSKPASGSPWLFAAGHVLRRPLAPRHPPYALPILTSFSHVQLSRCQSPSQGTISGGVGPADHLTGQPCDLITRQCVRQDTRTPQIMDDAGAQCQGIRRIPRSEK